jgi:tetratricopeptide (TPR) repeat protein
MCLFLLHASEAPLSHARSQSDSPARGVEYERLLSSGGDAADRQHYENAVGQYRKALAIYADDGAVHLALGKALYALNKYKEAATAYETAFRLGFIEAAGGAYQIAVCYALSADDESAFRWLETALRSRLKARSEIAADERFVRLRESPRFRDIVGQLPSTVTGREEGWKYDLRFLTSEIQRLHPSYAKELPPSYRRRLELLEKKLASLSDQQVVIEIMALVATLGDSHSLMAPFGMRKGVLSRLPLQLYVFSDGIFVIDAPQPELIGSKVLEIGGRDVAELGIAMRPYLSRDNDAFLPFEVAFGLTLPELLGVLGADTQGANVRLRLHKDERTIAVNLAKQKGPLDPEKLPLKLIAQKGVNGLPPDYLAHLDQNFWLKNLDPETLYVQINQCHDRPGRTLPKFASEMDGAVKATKPQNLVIDVRLNNGGDFESMFVIVKSIVAFEKSRPDARLFVIIGRNTLSAAQNFVSMLDQLCDPIFVGEPTGSRPNHAGDDTELVLPYSGMMGSISCAYHQTNYRDARQWIAPRIPIVLSSRAYFARKDPVMESVLLYIAERRVTQNKR